MPPVLILTFPNHICGPSEERYGASKLPEIRTTLRSVLNMFRTSIPRFGSENRDWCENCSDSYMMPVLDASTLISGGVTDYEVA
jgi:hypothetical protein